MPLATAAEIEALANDAMMGMSALTTCHRGS